MVRPTLLTLASELGVSRQTVSNVINAPHRVSPATRDRVEAAIRDSGYRPSATAQALRKQRSLTLAMRLYPTTDGINGAVMDRFLHSLVEQAELLGYRVMLFTASDDQHEAATLVDLFERHSIDGAILTATGANDVRPGVLNASSVPFGAFGRPWGQSGTTHLWADIDGRAGTRLATQYLVDHGHGPIGFLGWPEESGSGQDRYAGWLDVAREQPWFELGEQVLVERGPDGIAPGALAMAKLAGRGVRAAVCASDSLAVGALQALREQGPDLTAPRFIPLFGFDATPVARAIGLSSVVQPVDLAAEHLVHQLVAELDGPSAPNSDDDSGAARLITPTLSVLQTIPMPS